jgi:SAM-dependent methyltransferase
MSSFLCLSESVFIRVVENSTIISNPRLRLHVEVDEKTASTLLSHIEGLSKEDWEKQFEGCFGTDRTQRFIGMRGLVTDHSGFQVNVDHKYLGATGSGLLNLLRDRLILIEKSAETQSHVALMENLLDQEHLGSFHQRVGQYVLLGLRERETWRAWQNQKFSEDGLSLIGENYRQIQEPFFDCRFTHKDLSSLRVLDFGCGNGYFSAKFSDAGASVLALDSSKELMLLAQKNYGHRKGLKFIVVNTMQDSILYLNGLKEKSIDLIYLQDTLLLLLNPEGGLPSEILSELFQAFRRVLTSDGELAAMEPNAIFWLAGRYGNHETPYAVITEYRNHIFNVVPNLGDMLAPLANAGFGLVEYCHPEHADPSHVDYAYAKEFPIWDFFKFKVINS